MIAPKLDAAQQALVVQYMPLASSMRRQLTEGNPRVDKGDADGEAYLGLIEAARRFDTSRNVDFSVYAAYWIRARLLIYIMNASQGQVRHVTTANDRTVYFRLGRAQRALGAGATDAALAQHLGVTEAAVVAGRGRREHADVSIDAFTWTVTEIADRQSAPVDESVLVAEQHGALLQLVWQAPLDPRERQIIRERWLTEEPCTLDVLGTEWGVSRERVRQLEQRALGKLRTAAAVKEKRAQKKARARRRKFSKSRLAQSRP